MKKIFVIGIACFCLWSLRTKAQEKPEFNIASVPKELSDNANAVLRDYVETFTVDNPGKGKKQVRYAYTIYNKQGNDHAVLVVPYDKNKSIKTFEGRVYNPNGKLISKLKKAEILDFGYSSEFMDDTRYKVAQASSNDYPYTVEFEYEMTMDGLYGYPVFSPHRYEDISVEKASFEVIMPSELKLRYQERNFPKKAVVSNNSNKTIYHWDISNLPVQVREKYSPDREELVPVVYTAPTDILYEDYKGNMSNWENMGKFFAQLNQGRDVLSPETQGKVKAMVAGIPNKYDKIQKLYEYMQSKTRYVSIQLGIGGLQPAPAQEVDSKGFGDCKALSNYMKALLKVVGIESNYAIVEAGKRPNPIFKDFAYDPFNHVILCVPMEKDSVWIECTSQSYPAGFLGDFTDNRYALLITATGGKLAHTPVYKAKDNLQIRNADVILKETGDALIKVKTSYTGTQQDFFAAVSQLSVSDQRRRLNESINIPQFNLVSFKFEPVKKRIPIVKEELEIEVQKFAAKSGKRFFITPNLMNRYEINIPENENRKTDIFLSTFEYQDIDTIRYHVPENYHLEGTFNDIQYKSAFGEYSVKVKFEQGIVTYIRTFSRKNGKFPKEKYKEFVEFF